MTGLFFIVYFLMFSERIDVCKKNSTDNIMCFFC